MTYDNDAPAKLIPDDAPPAMIDNKPNVDTPIRMRASDEAPAFSTAPASDTARADGIALEDIGVTTTTRFYDVWIQIPESRGGGWYHVPCPHDRYYSGMQALPFGLLTEHKQEMRIVPVVADGEDALARFSKTESNVRVRATGFRSQMKQNTRLKVRRQPHDAVPHILVIFIKMY